MTSTKACILAKFHRDCKKCIPFTPVAVVPFQQTASPAQKYQVEFSKRNSFLVKSGSFLVKSGSSLLFRDHRIVPNSI